MTPLRLVAVATISTGLLVATPAVASAEAQFPRTVPGKAVSTMVPLADRSEYCIRYSLTRVLCWEP